MLVTYQDDPNDPPKLTPEEEAHLDALTDVELTRMQAAATLRQIRAAQQLSQSEFAAAYHINLARLRDLEQGRTMPDSALLTYLTVIAREPEAVRRALA